MLDWKKTKIIKKSKDQSQNPNLFYYYIKDDDCTTTSTSFSSTLNVQSETIVGDDSNDFTYRTNPTTSTQVNSETEVSFSENYDEELTQHKPTQKRIQKTSECPLEFSLIPKTEGITKTVK